MHAFESIEAALRFADRLAGVALAYDTGDRQVERERDLDRLNCVLELMIAETPIRRASLWKLKARAGVASVICAPEERSFNPPYVVPIETTGFRLLIDRHLEKIQDGEARRGIVHVDDIQAMATDPHWFTAEVRARHVGEATRLFAIPFGFPGSSSFEVRPYPHFIMVMTAPGSGAVDAAWIPAEIFSAITHKLLSGVSALIDRRMKRITEAMTSISVARANEGADGAIRAALLTVLPHFIQSEAALRLLRAPDGSYRCGMRHRFDGLAVDPLPPAAAQLLGRLAEAGFAAKDAGAVSDPKRRDSYLPSPDKLSRLNERLRPTGVAFESLLFGRVHNRLEPASPRGFIVLGNRVNDLAKVHASSRAEFDYFDWEDELYLNHICSVLDLIAELFTAEETRLTKAQILAHDISAPNAFIYATAERLKTVIEGRRKKPVQMQLKELDDIMDGTRLQSTLVDSMMVGMLQTGLLPPAERYSPSYADLDVLAREIWRLSVFECRRYRLDNTKIYFGKLPTLFIDKRAIMQICMNMITNAIKYADRHRRENFSVRIESELVETKELSATAAPQPLLAQIEAMRIRDGWLFSFEDRGIGFSSQFVPAAFASGTRDLKSEDVAARRGAGLGLSVVRAIARDHFGDAWVERLRAPTLFHVFLPGILRDEGYTHLDAWRKGIRRGGAG